MNRKLIIALLTFIIIIISACSNEDNNEESSGDELIIHTTLYPLQYVIEQIGKDAVTVDTIYPPGVDAHTYEPASKEITNLATGDAFVYLGAGIEGFAETAASALASQDVQLIELGKHKELFAEDDGHHDHDDHHHGDLDPHVWLDPLRMIEIGQILYDELVLLKPELADEFSKNLMTFEVDMVALDDTFEDTLTSEDKKPILVTHAAYGYWERSYGIEQLSISGLSTSDEPSQKQLAHIARTAKELQIKYVIFEQSNTNKTAEIIQEHIGAEKLLLHNLEVLTEQDIENNADYLSIMKDNLQILDQATK